MPVQTRSQLKALKTPVIEAVIEKVVIKKEVKKPLEKPLKKSLEKPLEKPGYKTRSKDKNKRQRKPFYDWVPVDANTVEKPFAGKEYDDAAARRESNRASNISSTPNHTTVTEEKLAELGLTPDSRDPTGKYKIVIASFKLGIEIGYNCDKKEKWAIAPPGYCWHEFSDSGYYNYDWYALCKIVTPEEKEEKEAVAL